LTHDAARKAEAALRKAQELHRAGRLDEARAACLQALERRPRQPDALLLLGIIAAQAGDLRGAVTLFERVLALDARNVAAHRNRGNALRMLKEPEAALASLDQALALEPRHVPTHNSRGRALFDLGRFEAAVASHDEAIALDARFAPAHLDRARALAETMRFDAALDSLDAAIALEPRHPGAWYLRGNASYAAGRLQAALESYDRVLALMPDEASAWHNRGNALFMLERYEEAIASYDRAIALDPDIASSHGERLHARMHIADWRDFAAEVARLTERIERDEALSNPFTLLALCGSAPLQKQAARNWVRKVCPPSGALPPLGARSRHAKLRIGYFSAEFHGHATASLTAGLLESHDRSRLEVTAFSLGPDIRDGMRARIEAAVDRFLEVRAQSDQDIARLARGLGIDIAVDLGGFTRGGRPGIFALRAAPLQVSYLGYLGTMAAQYMDYLIADDTIVPDTHRQHYSEQIVHLPGYQVGDPKRRMMPGQLERGQLGLPPKGFVFCCFNSTYKITPDTFGGWMRILARVPDSVLFLLGGRESLESNLRREALARGIDPQRLVFGGRLAAPEYLARYRTADLFLDTLPYNAGTTANDALWAGLPVLTCMGETFAGRIGASLLKAAGLPELIAASPQHYEALAVELASDPRRLAAVKAKLGESFSAAPRLDAAAFARHLEAAYARMIERYDAGSPPEHIRIEA
jgi:protein O-GlcNAc transferase